MLEFLVNELMDILGIGYYVLVYGVGILAMAFCVMAYQFKKRVNIILSNLGGQICWVLYFALQADLTSAITCALSAVMLSVFSKKGKWKIADSLITVIAFIIVIAGFSALSFKVWSDIFPLLAGIFGVITHSRATEKRLRQCSILWLLCWILNGVFKVYPIALINDSMCLVSSIIALVRFREKK
jgi:hypothetical protein